MCVLPVLHHGQHTEESRGLPPLSARVLPHQDSGATAGLFSLRLLSINQKITLSVPLSTA